MADYSKYKESAFTHEEMQPMIVESDMTDVFDDLAKAFKAGHDAGRSEAADEIERLREALRWIADNPFDGENPAHLMRLTARAALGEGKE